MSLEREGYLFDLSESCLIPYAAPRSPPLSSFHLRLPEPLTAAGLHWDLRCN